MGDVTFFFDTYALIEIYNGNKNYKNYKNVKIILSYFQLYEFYYNLMGESDKEEFMNFFNFLKNFCVELNFDWIPKASKLKQIYKKRSLSYTDCLGYIIAKELGVKF